MHFFTKMPTLTIVNVLSLIRFPDAANESGISTPRLPRSHDVQLSSRLFRDFAPSLSRHRAPQNGARRPLWYPGGCLYTHRGSVQCSRWLSGNALWLGRDCQSLPHQSAADHSDIDMAPLIVLLTALLARASAAAAAAGDDHSVLAVTKSGIMHLDSSGELLAWRPEVFQWWQAWHVATNPRNGTVCWVSAPENQDLLAVVRCAELINLNQTWDLPQPRGLRVNKPDAIALDWVNENWYLTESRVNYVCSYMFDRCVRLGRSGGNVRYFAAYDIPNRLLFRIATDTGPYRLEVLNLDGTGGRMLPTNITYPAGLAVDPVQKHVYILDSVFDIEIHRFDYNGENRKVIVKRDEVFGADWRRSIDVINSDIFVSWDDEKVVSRVSASDGKVEDLVPGAVRDQTVPALAKVDGLLAVKIFSQETQPEVEDRCHDAGCQHLCIPKVVNDTADTTCFCPEGEMLIDLSCQKTYPAYVVVTGPSLLQAIDLQTEQVTEILSNLTDVTELDIFLLGGEQFLLFWVDAGSLFRGSWSPGGVVSNVSQLVQASGTQRVLDVAVDWAQRNLVWIERDPSQKSGKSTSIKIAPLDGSYVKTLASKYGKDHQSLVIYGYGKEIAYAQNSWGDIEVEAIGMDGKNSYGGFASSSSKFLTSMPADITIDLSLGAVSWPDRTFWINNITNSIEALWRDWMFSSRRHDTLLTHPSLAHAGGLAVLDTRLFWTDRVTGDLWTANSVTGEDVRQLPVQTAGGDLRVLHPWLQPAPQQPVCDEQRNGCSHFCVRALVDWKWVGQCACPDGQSLQDDQKTCE